MADAVYVPKIVESAKWHPQRSDLRYAFIAAVQVLDPQSRKPIVSTTANLSRYGCHVRTSAALLPGTSIHVKITHQAKVFQSHGKVAYAISGEGMGIHFEDVGIQDRVVLKEWLVQVRAQELEHRPRQTPKPRITLSKEEKTILAVCGLGVAAILAIILRGPAP